MSWPSGPTGHLHATYCHLGQSIAQPVHCHSLIVLLTRYCKVVSRFGACMLRPRPVDCLSRSTSSDLSLRIVSA